MSEKQLKDNVKKIVEREFTSIDFKGDDVDVDFILSKVRHDNLEKDGILGPILIKGARIRWGGNIFRTPLEEDRERRERASRTNTPYVNYSKYPPVNYYSLDAYIPKDKMAVLYILSKLIPLFQDKTNDNSKIRFDSFNGGLIADPCGQRENLAVSKCGLYMGYPLKLINVAGINVIDTISGKAETVKEWKSIYTQIGVEVDIVAMFQLGADARGRKITSFVKSIIYGDTETRKKIESDLKNAYEKKQKEAREELIKSPIYQNKVDYTELTGV